MEEIPRPKRVLGIDPSLTSTACCWLDESGKFKIRLYGSEPAKGLIPRMNRYRQMVEDITAGPIWRNPPELVFIEGYSYGSTGRSVLDTAEFGGLLRNALLLSKCRVIEVPPTVLKKFMTGKGNAAKTLVVAEASRKWNVSFDTTDEYDALVLAHMAATFEGWETCNKAQTLLLEALWLVDEK